MKATLRMFIQAAVCTAVCIAALAEGLYFPAAVMAAYAAVIVLFEGQKQGNTPKNVTNSPFNSGGYNSIVTAEEPA